MKKFLAALVVIGIVTVLAFSPQRIPIPVAQESAARERDRRQDGEKRGVGRRAAGYSPNTCAVNRKSSVFGRFHAPRPGPA